MQESLVRPKHSEKCPHAEEVEDVDGMDMTVRADASDSEDAVVESQEVQGKAMEASQADQEEDVETQAPRSAKAPHVPSQREIDDHNLVHCPYRDGARPACEAKPRMIAIGQSLAQTQIQQ